jgi:superoxide dismutase, Fe-Mn family
MLTLPKLPYAYDALAPAMSSETLHLHHDKHHATYVEKANELAKKAGHGDMTLEDLICAAREGKDQKLFNNAAQAWNHAFFWESMSPAKSAPDGELGKAIASTFGDLAGLKKAFVEEGVNHFASGWVWLVLDRDTNAGNGGLEVISTHDADDTFTRDADFPLLVCDVWEHAYYLDCKNDRKAYLTRWFDELANWRFAAKQFEAKKAGNKGYRYPAMAAATG